MLKEFLKCFSKNSKRLAVTLLSSVMLVGSISPSTFAKDEYVSKLVKEMNPNFENFKRDKRIGLLMTCIFTEGFVDSKAHDAIGFGRKGLEISITKECIARAKDSLECLYDSILENAPNEEVESYLLDACFYIGASYRHLVKSRGLYMYYFVLKRQEPWKFLYYNGMMEFFDEKQVDDMCDFYKDPLMVYSKLDALVDNIKI